MSEEVFDVVIIGGGPGGYVAAIRAAQLGMKTAVVESRSALGGVCLNEGCIPSKALLDSSELFHLAKNRFSVHGILIDEPRLDLAKLMARKDDVVKKLTDGVAFLFKKNKIIWIQGTAKLAGPRPDGLQVVSVTASDNPAIPRLVNAKRVIAATGSVAAEIPGVPFDGEMVISAREALALNKVPEHLLVIGGGYIGLELGSVWLRLGSHVTVVEMLPKMLPTMDGQVADALVRSLKKQGFTFKLETRVAGFSKKDGKAVVKVSGETEEEIVCDKVLVAAGRKPLTAGLGLEEVKVEVGRDGRVVVNEDFQTSVPGIYAIGDLISGPMLAHKAMEEGAVCVERMTGQPSVVEYDYVPGIIYTWPEVASVGKTEERLKEEGVPYSVGRFNFMGNGRAKCMDETEGFVKILAHKNTGRVLGFHVIGPRASDMISEGVTAMTYGGTAEDIALTFHAHPTLAEAVKEAALDVEKRAIHA